MKKIIYLFQSCFWPQVIWRFLPSSCFKDQTQLSRFVFYFYRHYSFYDSIKCVKSFALCIWLYDSFNFWAIAICKITDSREFSLFTTSKSALIYYSFSTEECFFKYFQVISIPEMTKSETIKEIYRKHPMKEVSNAGKIKVVNMKNSHATQLCFVFLNQRIVGIITKLKVRFNVAG